jgi:hypothetical protein
MLLRVTTKLLTMNSIRIITGLFFAVIATSTFAQSKTTQSLQDQNKDAFSLYFYQNTLRMLNQKEDKEFDELIKDIEKMKFLMIKKNADFGATDYKKLVSSYQKESFEEIMTSRYDGKNLDIYLKEGKDKGMIVLVNDSTNFFVLDIVGQIALNKVTKLYSVLDESSDITGRIFKEEKKDAKKENDN